MICDNRTDPVVAKLIQHRPRQISRSPTNWNEKIKICGKNWKHSREKTIVRSPLFPWRMQRTYPKPGRKPEQGKFRHKPAPEPREQNVVQKFQASLDSDACPKCGSIFERQASETATTIDLPQIIGRVIKFFSLEVAECTECGHKFRGTHPELAKD